MTHYFGPIDRNPDGTFGVHFPDCPGCTAMGDTQEELFENAVEALREWMTDRLAEGIAAPKATAPLDLQDSVDIVETYGRNAQLAFLGVPLLLDAGRPARVNISLDVGLLEQIDDAAKLRGLTRSAFLASAAREKIKAAG